jgi:hypothetical protein
MAIDRRIINLGISINDQIRWYGGLNSPLYIEAKGRGFANPSMGDCDITVLGLQKDVRDFILQNTKPLEPNKTRISVVLEVGRESYGTHTRYRGDVFRSQIIGKPDTGLQLTCKTGFYNKRAIVTRSGSDLTKLSSIAQWVASDCGYGLSFEIDDRNIKSYSFTGSAQSQLNQLEDLADAEVFVDDDVLYVTDPGKPASGKAVRVVDVSSGLLEAGSTESGVRVTMLYDPVTTMKSQFDLESSLNPSINGSYVVFRSDYHVANRADPFYLIVEGNPIK